MLVVVLVVTVKVEGIIHARTIIVPVMVLDDIVQRKVVAEVSYMGTTQWTYSIFTVPSFTILC